MTDVIQLSFTSDPDHQAITKKPTSNTVEFRQITGIENLELSDNDSVISDASDESEMQPFEEYKSKIEALLSDLGIFDFSVEAIQHGYMYQNCVYALTSPSRGKKYILRVPVSPDLENADNICIAIENDAALLDYIGDKLPVPHVKAYDSTSDNALGTPFSIQTRLPGVSLDRVYDDLEYKEKLAIIDQFVVLLGGIQSITFDTAGTFVADSMVSLPVSGKQPTLPIKTFDEGPADFLNTPETVQGRRGHDLKAFLANHIHGWIQKEPSEGPSLTRSSYHAMLDMVEVLNHEGAFGAEPPPIVLHHWDLEPRNLMVKKLDSTWNICGIIDWDDAIALPRPLARKAPDWIWDFETEGFTGYLDTDHHPQVNLSDEALALKAYFDAKAAATLEGYLQDAYGHGRWLRRIWTFARSGLYSVWYIDLVKKLEEDWNARSKVESFPSSTGKVFLERILAWALDFGVRLHRWM